MRLCVGEAHPTMPTEVEGGSSPALELSPIGSAYTRTSRLASLGLSTLVWGLAGGLCLLGFRMQADHQVDPPSARKSVALLICETESQISGGGGHQGTTLKTVQEPPRPVAALPPPQSIPDNAPLPTALPTQPVAAPPALPSLGGGGTLGTGMGYGTGKGVGTGTGDGTGTAGNGKGSGTGEPPLVVPFSQIGLLKVIHPYYPERARQVGMEGDVVVRVTIDENGRPIDLHLVKGESLFVNEALKVLPQWRFTPVTHQGKRVRATFDAVLKFNLA